GVLCCAGLDPRAHRRALQPLPDSPRYTEGPAERLPAHGELVARGRGVQVRPATGCAAQRIGYDDRVAVRVRADGHPHQLSLGGSRSTSDTGPDRFARHRGSTLPPGVRLPEPGQVVSVAVWRTLQRVGGGSRTVSRAPTSMRRPGSRTTCRPG